MKKPRKKLTEEERRKAFCGFSQAYLRLSRIAALKGAYAGRMAEGDTRGAGEALRELSEVIDVGKNPAHVNKEFDLAPSWFANNVYNALGAIDPDCRPD